MKSLIFYIVVGIFMEKVLHITEPLIYAFVFSLFVMMIVDKIEINNTGDDYVG